MPAPYSNMTDQELLDKFYSDNDNNLLGILFERYTLLLFGLSMKYLKNEEESKDAVQQVFLKAITELKKYRVQYFKSWLYMVAKNHCLMKLRERNRFSSELKEEMITIEDITDTSGYIEKDKRLELMSSSIELLNLEQKQCVTLFYLEKKSYQEISTLMGYSILQVKSYIQNGKRNLKLLMEKKINKP